MIFEMTKEEKIKILKNRLSEIAKEQYIANLNMRNILAYEYPNLDAFKKADIEIRNSKIKQNIVRNILNNIKNNN